MKEIQGMLPGGNALEQHGERHRGERQHDDGRNFTFQCCWSIPKPNRTSKIPIEHISRGQRTFYVLLLLYFINLCLAPWFVSFTFKLVDWSQQAFISILSNEDLPLRPITEAADSCFSCHEHCPGEEPPWSWSSEDPKAGEQLGAERHEEAVHTEE